MLLQFEKTDLFFIFKKLILWNFHYACCCHLMSHESDRCHAEERLIRTVANVIKDNISNEKLKK